jgi:ABC-type polysaccharide/polyol phosphate export permease
VDGSRCRPSPLSDVVAGVRLWPVWVRLALQDLRLRFRRSVLGASWHLLHLLVSALVVGLVYARLFDLSPPSFLPMLTIGLVTWGLITTSVVEGSQAFVVAEGYIKQIGLPLTVYVLRAWLSNLVMLALGLVAYAVVAVACQVSLGWGVLWAVPGVALLASVSFLLVAITAHLNVRFRDVAHLTAVLLQLLFYVTPVLWPAELLRQRGWAWVVDLNPLYHLVELLRRPLLASVAADPSSYVAAGLVLGFLAAGAVLVMRRYRARVAYLL